MDKENNTNIFVTIVVSILIPVITVSLSFGIYYLKDLVGWGYTILILVGELFLIIVFVFTGVKIITYFSKEQLEQLIKNEFADIEQSLDKYILVEGIYSEDYLALMEKTGFFDEIWLVSPDLLTEIDDGIYADIVKNNIDRKIKYKYFVPNNSQNQTRVELFKKRCKYSKFLEIFFLDDNFFFLIPGVDFAIYEPYKSVPSGKKGYIGVNIEGEDKRCAIPMSNDFVDVFIKKLSEVCEHTCERTES